MPAPLWGPQPDSMPSNRCEGGRVTACLQRAFLPSFANLQRKQRAPRRNGTSLLATIIIDRAFRWGQTPLAVHARVLFLL